MKKTLLLCLLPWTIAASANQPAASDDSPAATPAADAPAATPAAPQPAPKNSDRVTGAVTAPLSDLNLVKTEIPLALRQAMKAPYAAPQPLDCPTLAAQVLALDAALGPDLDAPPNPTKASLVERGTDAAGKAAVGALRSTAEGLVPFRSWVRKASGAERHAKEVAAAIAAGTVNRAFLKGLGQSLGCAAPASPIKPPMPEPASVPDPAAPAPSTAPRPA